MANVYKDIKSMRYVYNWSDDSLVASAVTFTIGSLPPGAIVTDIKVDVITQFNSGTSDTLTIGHGAYGATAADVDEFETAIDLKTAAGRIALTLLRMNEVISSTENVPITGTYTAAGTTASAGKVGILIEYVQL